MSRFCSWCNISCDNSLPSAIVCNDAGVGLSYDLQTIYSNEAYLIRVCFNCTEVFVKKTALAIKEARFPDKEYFPIKRFKRLTLKA